MMIGLNRHLIILLGGQPGRGFHMDDMLDFFPRIPHIQPCKDQKNHKINQSQQNFIFHLYLAETNALPLSA